jgi:PHD/YefM family antitoxin component YafN of YafNO toxin-antitoxin module
MLLFTGSEAKERFDDLLDLVQREPVQVTSDTGVIGVFVSSADYEVIHKIYVDQLLEILEATAQRASQAGLTEQELERLLASDD